MLVLCFLFILCFFSHHQQVSEGKKYVINISKLPMSLHLNFNHVPPQELKTDNDNSSEIIETPICTCGIAGTGRRRHEKRIWGGRPSSTRKYPWHVTLGTIEISGFRNVTTAYCGGSLITKRHVITAYHCITTQYEKGMYDRIFVIGHSGNQRRFHDILVRKIDRHPLNKPYGIHEYDIAVLTLDQDVEGVMPICLPNLEKHRLIDADGTQFTIIGRGYEGPKRYEDNPIKEAEVTALSKRTCQKAYERTPVEIMPFHLCATSPTADTCGGDSGGNMNVLLCHPNHSFQTFSGALMWFDEKEEKYYLAGVVSQSYGDHCNGQASEFPALYHDVYSTYDWINFITGGLDSCK